MSLAVLLGMVAVFLLGALVPREKDLKQRFGLGAIAAATVWFVSALWPETDAPLTATNAAGEWPYLLTLLIFVPIVASVGVLFLPRQALQSLRYFTYAAMGATFIASLYLLKADATPGWHFQHIKPWIPALGIRYHVALDGISLWLVILTTFMSPIAMFAAAGSIKTRVKELCFAFLFLEGAMIGAFVALDLFLFYVFWELMLVPMYLMIGIWGGADKIKAAIKFFLYTMTGSVLMLAAIVYLVWTHQRLTGHYTFDYVALMHLVPPKAAQQMCFWAFAIAFFIKVPMWPVHTWLPDAHVQAPTGGSVILAAVMLKLGTYAYMRFCLGLFPYAATMFAPNLAGVAILGGIVYAALVAWKQDDVKKLIAYSSVAHLGYIMLGLFGNTVAGMQGAVLQMVNHGISTGALFLLVGVAYDRTHTRAIKDYGGIAKVMPVYATLFLIATFASVGVPGTNGFVGEFMVIMGTYSSAVLDKVRDGGFSGIHTVGAAFGVILAAVYMLSVVQKVFFGKLSAANKHLSDISPRETLALAPLVVMIFVIGFFPNIFLARTKPSVAALAFYVEKANLIQAQADEKRAQIMPTEMMVEMTGIQSGYLKGLPTFDEPTAPGDANVVVGQATPEPGKGAGLEGVPR
ncbi:MAG: NADH-quinone oxidoreductase subunit M [Polyangiaceae bacterium]